MKRSTGRATRRSSRTALPSSAHATSTSLSASTTRVDYVKPCLASVIETIGPRHRVIVIDDASESEVGDYLHDLCGRNDRLCIRRNSVRAGYTKSANKGLRLSSADLVILLNSDTIVAPNWIEKLCDAVYTTEGRASLVRYPMLQASNRSPITARLQSKPPSTDFRHDYLSRTWIAIVNQSTREKFCRACRSSTGSASVFAVRSSMQSGCSTRRFLQTDRRGRRLCLRASEAGFELVVATHTYVFHAKTKSYTPAQRQVLTTAAGQALRARHGKAQVDRAFELLDANSILNKFRREASRLYVTAPSNGSVDQTLIAKPHE